MINAFLLIISVSALTVCNTASAKGPVVPVLKFENVIVQNLHYLETSSKKLNQVFNPIYAEKSMNGFSTNLYDVALIVTSGASQDIWKIWEDLSQDFKNNIGNVVTVSFDTKKPGEKPIDIGGGMVIGDDCMYVMTAAHNVYKDGAATSNLIVRPTMKGIILGKDDAIKASTISSKKMRGQDSNFIGVGHLQTGQDWAIVKLKKPLLQNGECHKTLIETDLDETPAPSNQTKQAMDLVLIGGQIDPDRHNKSGEFNTISITNCSRYPKEDIDDIYYGVKGIIPNDCFSTSSTSGYPLFVNRKSGLRLVGILTSEFISTFQTHSEETSTNNIKRSLRYNRHSVPVGAINAATSINGDTLGKMLRNKLYKKNPNKIISSGTIN